MRKHSQHNKDERTHFFRKIYLSHFIRNDCKRVTKGLCVRGELETEQTAYWPPVPLSLAALLSRSAECWFSLQHLISNLTDSNWLNLSVAPSYIIVWRSPASYGRHICTQFNPSIAKVIYPDIFDRIHLFLDRRLGRRSICYTRTTLIRTCGTYLGRIYESNTTVWKLFRWETMIDIT